MNRIGKWLERRYDGSRKVICSRPFNLVDESQPRFVLGQRDDSLSVAFADYSIQLPVAYTPPGLYDGRPRIDRGPSEGLASPLIGPVVLELSVLVAKVVHESGIVVPG